MHTEQMSRDFQEILINTFQKRIVFMGRQDSKQEMRGLLQEMQHIVQTYPLDDDIIDAMSSIVDRIMAVITVNDVYNRPERLH